MKVTPTKTGITLSLTVREAIALEAILGRSTGIEARNFPYYDWIADVLESHHHIDNIYNEVEKLREEG